MEVIHLNQEQPASPSQADVQEIVSFGHERGWHVLVLAGQTGQPPQKGLLIAQPGRPQGVLKVLVDVEPEAAG